MPAYNEANSIAENVCETVETMHALGLDFEIVVIDDGSLDGTHAAASNALRAWPDHVRVVRCRQNEGKGNALICGALYSRGEYVAFLDADMDLHPEQLAELFRDHAGARRRCRDRLEVPPGIESRLSAAASRLQFFLLPAGAIALRVAGSRHANRHQALQTRGSGSRASANFGEAIRLRPRAARQHPSLRFPDRRSSGNVELQAGLQSTASRYGLERLCRHAGDLLSHADLALLRSARAYCGRVSIVSPVRTKSSFLSPSESKRAWVQVPRWCCCYQGSATPWPRARFCAA